MRGRFNHRINPTKLSISIASPHYLCYTGLRIREGSSFTRMTQDTSQMQNPLIVGERISTASFEANI